MHPLLLLHNKYIPDIISYTFLVMAILTLLGWLATRRIGDLPGQDPKRDGSHRNRI